MALALVPAPDLFGASRTLGEAGVPGELCAGDWIAPAVTAVLPDAPSRDVRVPEDRPDARGGMGRIQIRSRSRLCCSDQLNPHVCLQKIVPFYKTMDRLEMNPSRVHGLLPYDA
jgi:hypothetical protein